MPPGLRRFEKIVLTLTVALICIIAVAIIVTYFYGLVVWLLETCCCLSSRRKALPGHIAGSRVIDVTTTAPSRGNNDNTVRVLRRPTTGRFSRSSQQRAPNTSLLSSVRSCLQQYTNLKNPTTTSSTTSIDQQTSSTTVLTSNRRDDIMHSSLLPPVNPHYSQPTQLQQSIYIQESCDTPVAEAISTRHPVLEAIPFIPFHDYVLADAHYVQPTTTNSTQNDYSRSK